MALSYKLRNWTDQGIMIYQRLFGDFGIINLFIDFGKFCFIPQ